MDKKTRRKHRPGAFLAAMICLVAAFFAVGVAQNQRVYALTMQVNAAYQKALYESVSLMSGIQLNLEKLLVSGANVQEQTLLTNIAQQSEGVQSNLSSMPLGEELLGSTMKFVNQTGDYARVLSGLLSGGGKLMESDVRQLITLHDASVQLNDSLSGILNQYERGDLVFEVDQNAINAARNLKDESEPMVQYPVLLYDGPFSDAAQEGLVTLTGSILDAAQAQQQLAQFVGADRVTSIRYVGESNLMGTCYEFEMQTQDGALSAGITQQGGHILYILPEQGNTEVLLTQGECIDMAQRFLASRGYGNMEISYWRQLGGILTVNFASVQDGVLLYPDLIKLQISMKNGLVIGMEAGNYLKNHTLRELVVPAFTREQALDALGAVLTPERIRQCIIPVESGEVQCWEINAQMTGGNRYLVYMDVLTGEERSILRVMVEDDGVLAQ